MALGGMTMAVWPLGAAAAAGGCSGSWGLLCPICGARRQ